MEDKEIREQVEEFIKAHQEEHFANLACFLKREIVAAVKYQTERSPDYLTVSVEVWKTMLDKHRESNKRIGEINQKLTKIIEDLNKTKEV